MTRVKTGLLKCDVCGQSIERRSMTLVWIVQPGFVSRYPALVHDHGVNGCFDRYEDTYRSHGLVMSRSVSTGAVDAFDEYDWHEDAVKDVLSIRRRLTDD
jgi:hypothetical protein